MEQRSDALRGEENDPRRRPDAPLGHLAGAVLGHTRIGVSALAEGLHRLGERAL